MISGKRMGCAAVLLYCIACSIVVEVAGRGFFMLVGDIATLHGGRGGPKWMGHALDIVTAPVQVTILWPFLAIDGMCRPAMDKKQEGLGTNGEFAGSVPKNIHASTGSVPLPDLCPWNSIAEMESDICITLTNDEYLASAAFSDKLDSATNSASFEMKTEAFLLLSVHAYQNFLNTADDRWLCQELSAASNAVVSAGSHADTWQYWMARFAYASAQISQRHFGDSYSNLVATIAEFAESGYTNEASPVETALLRKYEMPDLQIVDAMKVFAGMAAAELGMGNVATNYANQVPMPYRSIIIDFVR